MTLFGFVLFFFKPSNQKPWVTVNQNLPKMMSQMGDPRLTKIIQTLTRGGPAKSLPTNLVSLLGKFIRGLTITDGHSFLPSNSYINQIQSLARSISPKNDQPQPTMVPSPPLKPKLAAARRKNLVIESQQNSRILERLAEDSLPGPRRSIPHHKEAGILRIPWNVPIQENGKYQKQFPPEANPNVAVPRVQQPHQAIKAAIDFHKR